MKTLKVVGVLCLSLLTGVIYADSPMHATYTGSAELERMKQLAGSWHGTHVMQGKEQEVRVIYEITSAGSAVVERHFPGSPNEMISVYHDDKGRLSMTHYCALKNQPVLGLKSSTENSIALDYTDGYNIDPAKDVHMHSLTIDFVDDSHIVENWAMLSEGERKESDPIKLTRVKE
ncbi:MAG: hypothetical protein LJE83_01600 [Gammaproteobacteria bacterium]|nr:hypothetical protein [Gammaproteobacteria bacterium]